MNLENSLKGHFLNLYHMALSDADIHTKELEMLYRIGEEKGISKEEIDTVVIHPDSVELIAPESVLEKIESLYDFARIAWADGRIDPLEKKIMEMFCTKFGFREENVPTIVQFLLDEAEKGTDKSIIFQIVTENT